MELPVNPIEKNKKQNVVAFRVEHFKIVTKSTGSTILSTTKSVDTPIQPIIVAPSARRLIDGKATQLYQEQPQGVTFKNYCISKVCRLT